MKHRNGNKKLNKPTDQRLAMLKSIVISLVNFNQITTTTLRAKEAKKIVERLITIAKTNTVHSKRQVFKVINNKEFVKKIFAIAEKFKDKNGGYTRLIKKGIRRGDAAELSMIEFV
ncbi:50S ribosomal protein L17 [Candidatus Marinamargulisbacteria bacterium SCGC AG-343-D04]|nr:50S ribosomal protein L17 [Candidatus Marinamargulisbacteria bacterium SCGC AG-343-D04]